MAVGIIHFFETKPYVKTNDNGIMQILNIELLLLTINSTNPKPIPITTQ